MIFLILLKYYVSKLVIHFQTSNTKNGKRKCQQFYQYIFEIL